ncbi:MAG: DNA polymerase Y family protein [Thermoanaerobaculia bacterium]|nr:DNA polymerase Y family protein [Thermoanaerobaculia bacterium]
MRLACFHIPLFSLAARLRSEPELRGEALAIVEGSGSRAYVAVASKRARKLGIRSGMTLPQARAILPRLVARSRDSECEHSAQEALLEVAESLSPRVEDAEDGVVFLDLEGLEGLYRPDGKRSGREGKALPWEHAFASEAFRVAETAGLPVWIGIASSKLAARVASESPRTPVIVSPGEETRFLAELPLERLDPEIEIATTLSRWGLSSIGDLAKLPEAEIATRLGEAGRRLHLAARGVDSRPIIPRVPPPQFREGTELEWPLVALEPFLFVARAALERLSQRMERLGYACRRLEVAMRLEPDGHHHRAIDLPAPTRDVKTLLTLLKLDVEANPPGAPIASFTLIAHPDQPRRAQLSLFGPLEISPDRLATTIARLAALVGEDRVGSPRDVDSHVPSAVSVADFTPPPPPKMRREPAPNRGLFAIRALRPPMELEVIVEEKQGSESELQPTRIRALEPKKTMPLDGPVRIASGPWTMEEGWWSDSPTSREYWDLELVRGGIYRVYRDRRDGRWFADAVYD